MIAWRYKGRIIESVLVNKDGVELIMEKGRSVKLAVDVLTLRNISGNTEFYTIMWYLSRINKDIFYGE